MTGDRPSSARPDLRERIARRFFGLVNPLARRMISAGVPTGAPNILLIVRGRRSGIERTTPVGMLDFDGHSYVQASYGAAGWARNLGRHARRGDRNPFRWPSQSGSRHRGSTR